MQRVRNFVRAERILRVTRIIVLVTSLHVPQSQGIVLPDIGSGKLIPVKRTFPAVAGFALRISFALTFVAISCRHVATRRWVEDRRRRGKPY